jgi:hypothetical protein
MNFQKAMERAERELDDAKDHEYYLVIEKNVLVFLSLPPNKRRNFSAGAVIFVAKGHGSHPWTYKF